MKQWNIWLLIHVMGLFANAGSFNTSIVTDVPYWEGVRGFFGPHWTLLNIDQSKCTITS